MTLLDTGEARRLFVDGVRWAWGCDPNQKDAPREKACAEIARRRGR
jgi:hypothetical protein